MNTQLFRRPLHDPTALGLVVIMLLALALRTEGLASRELTCDEAFSWRISRCGFSELVRRSAADTHPPLYFVLLKVWSCFFGESLVALRSLSLAAALGSLPAAFLATARIADAAFATLAFDRDARRRRGQLGGLCVAALLACHPLQVSWGAVARMYSLAVLLAAIVAWLFVAALRVGDSILRWMLYGAAMAALLSAHHVGWFVFAAHACWIFGVICLPCGATARFRPAALGWASGASFAMALYSPLLPSFVAQCQRVAHDFWLPAHSALPSASLLCWLLTASRQFSAADMLMHVGLLCLIAILTCRRFGYAALVPLLCLCLPLFLFASQSLLHRPLL